jgi:hypothetical protein
MPEGQPQMRIGVLGHEQSFLSQFQPAPQPHSGTQSDFHLVPERQSQMLGEGMLGHATLLLPSVVTALRLGDIEGKLGWVHGDAVAGFAS